MDRSTEGNFLFETLCNLSICKGCLKPLRIWIDLSAYFFIFCTKEIYFCTKTWKLIPVGFHRCGRTIG